MEKVTLSTDLINNILSYLGNQPFVEVAPLINEIHKQAKEQVSAPSAEVLDQVGQPV
jgi:hypothetical protein